ncbi:unnamed protein product [Eruca vesicaria subsp. sativa]|uniref:MBD domain-containing protein n=1 Tax=Eruca vesicaria subsp. sativa TaxID=29727 RepID=A0ABC8M611_ERUVS|nr:unnamed protein product [Eruca vesicaria subsp. sativa]
MDGEGISDERKVEIRKNKNGRKVIVEKSAAEGLPEGWIKKLVISNRSGRKRRDPFFIDPQSEYIFPSFKAASRYVETGDIGHYARKFKESDTEDDDSGNGKNVFLMEPAEALLEKEKNIDNNVRDSKQRSNSSSSCEHFENGKTNSNLSIVNSQVLGDLGKKKDVKDPIENQPIAKRVTRSQAKASKIDEEVNVISRPRSGSSQSPEKKSVAKEEDVRDSTENGIRRSKAIVKNNELTIRVARRASKRLAGIELETTPELNTRAKAQRVVPLDDDDDDDDDGTAGSGKQPVNPIAATSILKTMDTPITKEVTKSYNTEHSSPKPNPAGSTSMNLVSAELEMQIENIGKPDGRNVSGDKKKTKMPLMMTSEAELNPVFRLDGYKQKEEMSPGSPLSRKTSATKREKAGAGKNLGRSSTKATKVTSPKATEVSPLRSSSNKGEHPHPSGKSNATQKRNKLSSNSFESSVVRGTCSDVMEMNNTTSFSSPSSAAFDLTLADLWKDPCIAFAIKTLIGDTLRLPNNIAVVSSDPNSNHAKQKGVTFLPETPQNANTYIGVSSESPAGMDIWKDPCIDFAIKTLTGAIPIGSNEPAVKPKPEGMTMTSSARQEQEGRPSSSSSCDYVVQQCSNNMKNKTMGKPGDLRFSQAFSKD